MKVSDYIIDFLAANDVQHIFYLIGGAVTHLVDSSIDHKNLSCVTMHHEQAAAFAAEGYARCNGKLGVAMATSGPGATNLITGIGSCFFDSVPCLFITGQVNTYEYKFNKPVRQIGFQETDIVSIIRPITKGTLLVEQPENIRRDLEWAVFTAQSGRPGPVLLDIPMNIQRAEIDPDNLRSFFPEPKEQNLSETMLEEIITKLSIAERPVVLVGGGVRTANACSELFDFVSETSIPIVSSLMGLDAFPHDNPSYVGFLGAYGQRSANFTVANSDFLLVLGSRLDTRQTGTNPKTFARAATVVHVDIDADELNRSVQAQFTICTHLKEFLQALNSRIRGKNIKAKKFWLEYVAKCKAKYPSFNPSQNDETIIPNEFIYTLSQQIDEDAIITVDVGQHQMWVAQSFEVKQKQRVLISGGMGSMGFALPAAIGAAFLDPNRQIIVIVGDGGMQMNIQELQTIRRNNLNIKIIVLNNNSLGMVRQFQEIYFNGRTEGTLDDYDCPDFVNVAEAYGIAAIRIKLKSEVVDIIKKFLQSSNCGLLEVMLPQSSQVEPKLIVNQPIEAQAPELSKDEFAEMMLIPSVI